MSRAFEKQCFKYFVSMQACAKKLRLNRRSFLCQPWVLNFCFTILIFCCSTG